MHYALVQNVNISFPGPQLWNSNWIFEHNEALKPHETTRLHQFFDKKNDCNLALKRDQGTSPQDLNGITQDLSWLNKF